MVDHLERTGRIIASASDAADMRRRMGAAALELDADADGSVTDRWHAIAASRLPSQSWPDQQILVTAVDAVAASTPSGVPYRIGVERYIDGGYRRNENADLATGFDRVLVLSPFGGRTRHPLEWGMQLAAQVDELRARGSRVETVFPNDAALAAFGDNMMDPSARPPAARAGYEHGRALAVKLSELWG